MGAKIFISGSGPDHHAVKLEESLLDWLAGRARVVFAGGEIDGWDIVLAMGDEHDPETFVTALKSHLQKSPIGADAKVRWVKHDRANPEAS